MGNGVFDLLEVRDNAGTISVLLGLALLVLSVLLFTMLGNPYSASCLFFGITFVALGIFAKIGMFWVKLHSRGGLGTVLICASIVFFAFSLALFQFLSLQVTASKRETITGRAREPIVTPSGGPRDDYRQSGAYGAYRLIFHSEPLYLGAQELLLLAATVLLIIGIALRIAGSW
jgi:hypothetical protein